MLTKGAVGRKLKEFTNLSNFGEGVEDWRPIMVAVSVQQVESEVAEGNTLFARAVAVTAGRVVRPLFRLAIIVIIDVIVSVCV